LALRKGKEFSGVFTLENGMQRILNTKNIEENIGKRTALNMPRIIFVGTM